MTAAFDLPIQLCPLCGYLLECSTNMTGGDGPQEGDVTVCISCAGLLAFEKNSTLKAVSITDLEPGKARDTVIKLIELVKDAKRPQSQPVSN